MANTTIRAETKSLKHICNELRESVEKLRMRKSAEHNQKIGVINITHFVIFFNLILY